jgi:thiol-disulfide isomerase/thioredoxin
MEMNKSIIILVILMVFAAGCKKSNEIIISGKITGNIPGEIFCSVPVDGVDFPGFKESIKPDSSGSFQVRISSTVSSFITFFGSDLSAKKIIVRPGDKITIAVNTTKGSESFIVSGSNEAGQNLYLTLPDPMSIQMVANTMLDYSPDSLKTIIAALKTGEMSKFKELLDKNEISGDFYNLVSADRNCYYALLTTTIAYIKLCDWGIQNINSFPPDMKKMWGDAYTDLPVGSGNLSKSPWWFEYIDTYLKFKDFMSGSFNLQEYIDCYKNGIIHTHRLKIADSYLAGQELECYKAEYIYAQALQMEYEKEFITIFGQFKTDFPNSRFTSYLEPLISPIIEYYRKIEQPLSNKISFVRDYKNINTLDECLADFKGKKVYIDVWATWCGPCKQEFEHEAELSELLKSKGIEMLYISIDDDQSDQKWNEMIKFYNLEGNHIRANEKLSNELHNLFSPDGTMSIPWFMLAGSNGKILIKHANRPSHMEELEKELN